MMPIPELVWFDITKAIEAHRQEIENLLKAKALEAERLRPVVTTLGQIVDALERYQRALNPEAFDKARAELGLPNSARTQERTLAEGTDDDTATAN